VSAAMAGRTRWWLAGATLSSSGGARPVASLPFSSAAIASPAHAGSDSDSHRIASRCDMNPKPLLPGRYQDTTSWSQSAELPLFPITLDADPALTVPDWDRLVQRGHRNLKGATDDGFRRVSLISSGAEVA